MQAAQSGLSDANTPRFGSDVKDPDHHIAVTAAGSAIGATAGAGKSIQPLIDKSVGPGYPSVGAAELKQTALQLVSIIVSYMEYCGA